MTLSVDVRRRQGDFRLDASFESAGRVTALFGDSGSGKSTLVNLVSGLLRPDDGRIVLDGVVYADTAARRFVPPHRRGVGYVFQDARLFPHMSVASNLAYGTWFGGRAGRRSETASIVEMLGIGHLLKRRPASLSGGERQRVGIGRALLAGTRLILMDEPLASLDDARKAEILPYLERLRDEARVPIVYVSHSVSEVSRLADEVVVLAAGRVAAQGRTADILSRRDLLPAGERREAGSSLVLTVVGHDERFGLTELRSAAGSWRLARIDAAPGAAVDVRVRSRDVMLALSKPEGISAINVLPGRIAAIVEGPGAEATVELDCGGERLGAAVTRHSVAALGLRPGLPVFAVVKAVALDG